MCTLREVAGAIDALGTRILGLTLRQQLHQNPDDTTTPREGIHVRLQEDTNGPETFLWVYRTSAESTTFRDMRARQQGQPQPFRRLVTGTVDFDREFIWDGNECWSADESARAIVEYMRDRLWEARSQPFH